MSIHIKKCRYTCPYTWLCTCLHTWHMPIHMSILKSMRCRPWQLHHVNTRAHTVCTCPYTCPYLVGLGGWRHAYIRHGTQQLRRQCCWTCPYTCLHTCPYTCLYAFACHKPALWDKSRPANTSDAKCPSPTRAARRHTRAMVRTRHRSMAIL